MMTASPALECTGLRKEFGDKVAVANLTLAVQRGEVFGFLGPNGAGKTTAIKMFLGLAWPTAGMGSVLGAPLGEPAARARVGFLPEHFRFHEWLTGLEFLRLHADLYGMPAEAARRRIGELLERVGLSAHGSKKLREYSKGMLQRIGLAQALLNEPELVILDEPTSGLDPVGRRLVREVIGDLRRRGTAVFLNSHLLSEVEVTCDHVAFIRHGEVPRAGPMQSLLAGRLVVEIRARGLGPEDLAGLSAWGQEISQNGELFTFGLQREADLPEINRYLVGRGVEVFSLAPRSISLEDLFLEVVGTEGGL